METARSSRWTLFVAEKPAKRFLLKPPAAASSKGNHHDAQAHASRPWDPVSDPATEPRQPNPTCLSPSLRNTSYQGSARFANGPGRTVPHVRAGPAAAGPLPVGFVADLRRWCASSTRRRSPDLANRRSPADGYVVLPGTCLAFERNERAFHASRAKAEAPCCAGHACKRPTTFVAELLKLVDE